MQRNPATAWLSSIPKTSKAGLGTLTGTPWPRGRMLGGTGSIDYMSYLRGHSRDFDQWLAQGNPTWGWSDVLEYFKKSERINVAAYGDSQFHGHSGPLVVSKNKKEHPFQRIL